MMHAMAVYWKYRKNVAAVSALVLTFVTLGFIASYELLLWYRLGHQGLDCTA